MKRKIEDILSGESPHENLEKESVNDTRNVAKHILKILQPAKAEKLSPDAYTELWERIEKTNQKNDYRNRAIKLLKYSAVACVLIGFTFVFWIRADTDTSFDPLLQTALDNYSLITQEHEVSLRGGNGAQLRISDEQQLIDLRSPEKYKNITKEEEPTFSTLTVPYGRRMEVILPDSSKVWLNAGSQLTFPTVFNEKERQVYLEGEGYFDVKKDIDRPFHVYTSNMMVRVLGTTFNVSSYKDDDFASTVLLSGEIELQGKGETSFDPQILKPGTAAVLRKENKSLLISNEPVEDYVSWRDKQLVLKGTPLHEIIARLERVYNTDIDVESSSQTDETFSGRLDLTQPLSNLLTALYNPADFQLKKEERRIVIKRK